MKTLAGVGMLEIEGGGGNEIFEALFPPKHT